MNAKSHASIYLRHLNLNQVRNIHRIYSRPVMSISCQQKQLAQKEHAALRTAQSVSSICVLKRHRRVASAKWPNVLWKNKGENIKIKDAIKMGRMYESLLSKGRRCSSMMKHSEILEQLRASNISMNGCV